MRVEDTNGEAESVALKKRISKEASPAPGLG